MIPRRLTSYIRKMLGKFPVVSLTGGPRQLGKTTLLTHAFLDYKYLNFRSWHNLLIINSINFIYIW